MPETRAFHLLPPIAHSDGPKTPGTLLFVKSGAGNRVRPAGE